MSFYVYIKTIIITKQTIIILKYFCTGDYSLKFKSKHVEI